MLQIENNYTIAMKRIRKFVKSDESVLHFSRNGSLIVDFDIFYLHKNASEKLIGWSKPVLGIGFVLQGFSIC